MPKFYYTIILYKYNNNTILLYYIICRVCRIITQNNEEIQNLQKRISHLETDLESAKSQLTETSDKLETRNTTLANVRRLVANLSSLH